MQGRSIVSRLARARGAGRGLACGLGLMAGAADAQSARPADILVVAQPVPTDPALARITTSIVDTPQAISTVTADEIQRRGVATLTEALRGVPGISLGAGETSWQGNNFYLRGFTTRNDTFLDGMRDYGYYYRDPFNYDKVEVLKGPSSVLFGRGSTGGAINQVSKRPERAGFADGQVVAGSDRTTRATVDIDLPFGATGAVRLDAMGTRSKVADRDGALAKRWGVAPSATIGLGTATVLTLSWLHQEEDNRPDYGIPWFNGAPARVARDNFYGFRSDYLDTNVDVVTGTVKHEVSSALTLRTQVRYSSARRRFRTSEAVIPAGTAVTTPLSAVTVSRNEFSGYSNDRFLQGQADATVRFTTGPFTHALVAGIEAGREHPNPTYIFHIGVIGTSLADPQPQAYAETASYVRLTATTRTSTFGAYAFDSVTLGDHLQLLAGLRWDRFDAHYRSTGYNPAGAAIQTTAVDRDDRRFSGRGAFVYKPGLSSSVYVSYASSFNPSAEGIESLVSAGRSVAQANLNAKPETSRSWEAGGKRELFADRLMLTAALFRTIKDNVRVPDPNVTGFNFNGGRQRVQGVELEATGRITPDWSVHLGYAYLDSETLTTDNPNAAGSPRIGEDLVVTPRHSASV